MQKHQVSIAEDRTNLRIEKENTNKVLIPQYEQEIEAKSKGTRIQYDKNTGSIGKF